MIESEIVQVMAYWEATFRQPLSPSEKALYLHHLALVEQRDAQGAIDRMARAGEFPPTAQRIAEVAVDCRYERLELEGHTQQRALEQGDGPGLGEYLEQNPDAREVLDKIRNAPVMRPDPPMTAAEREEQGQLVPPARQPVPMNLCTGVGKQLVWNERYGEHCCSGCGGPRSVGCWSEDSASYRAYHRQLADRQEATT